MWCFLDCLWSEWSSWGPCPATCGPSVFQYRSRSVKGQALYGGKQCAGEFNESKLCIFQSCPIGTLKPCILVILLFEYLQLLDCVWSDWSAWDACPVTCLSDDTPIPQYRNRSFQIEAQFGGKPCLGEFKESQFCNLSRCPIDCVWSDWSAWGPACPNCLHDDNPIPQYRNRSFKVETKFGGKSCLGEFKESQTCNLSRCPIGMID